MFLSIVALYYNCGPYIYSCLKSVDEALSGLKDLSIEVIIVDDFNNPEQVSILTSTIDLLENRSQFRVVRPNQNLGLSDARNFGVEHAKGEYIFFLDSDDYVNDKHLVKVINILKDIKTDVIYFNSHTFRGDDWYEMGKFSFQPRCIVEVDDEVASQYLQDSTFYAWRFMIKKSIALKEKFHSRLYMEDIATTPVLLSSSKTLWYEPISVINYRVRPNSVMTTWNEKKFLDMIQAPIILSKEMSNRYASSNLVKEQLRLLGYQFFYWAISDARQGDKSKTAGELYPKIKSLYVNHFGPLNTTSDFKYLKKLYRSAGAIRWVVLYHSYTMYDMIYNRHGENRLERLTKKIRKYGIYILIIILFIKYF